jgi:carboxypeptidase D
MNFSAITDGTARIPSSVGNDVKPAFTESNPASAVPSTPSAKTPEQDKAMWEGTISFSNLQCLSHSHAAYYNAGSSAIVLILILAGLATVLWCRIRRRRLRGLVITKNEEEHIPLTQSLPAEEDRDSPDSNNAFGRRKGKERAQEAGSAPIFDVGELDEDGEHNH